MRVHLPSGRIVTVPATVAAAATIIADFCPLAEEHGPRRSPRSFTAEVHEYCGLPVIWVPKVRRRT